METEVTPKSWPSELLPKDWSKRRCFAPGSRQAYAQLHELEVRDDDVWVVTLPKCGTTWMQELVWLVMHDYDFEAARAAPLEERSPFVEFPVYLGDDSGNPFRNTEETTSPRLVKSHLPLPLLPKQLWAKKPKVIYVFRDPKDALVSRYHFMLNFGQYLDKTTEQALAEMLDFEEKTDAFWQHVTEFYALRNEPWVFYTSFERMKADLRAVILDVVRFLDKAITEEQMQQMLKHLSFAEMKKNPQCSHQTEINAWRQKHQGPTRDVSFIRKGQVGGYKDELSPEFVARLDAWTERSLRPHGVTLNELLLLAPAAKES